MCNVCSTQQRKRHVPQELTPVVLLLLAVTFALASTACRNQEEPHTGLGTSTASTGVTTEDPNREQSVLTDELRGQVLAKVGDQIITIGDFERRLQAHAPYGRMRFASPERRQELLEEMIQFELLALEASRIGLDKDPEVVAAANQAMVRRLMASTTNDIAPDSITDEDTEHFYRENLAEFHRPAMVRASHILLESEEEAHSIQEKLKAERGADQGNFRLIFANHARLHSRDPDSSPRGGDLRFFALEDGWGNPDTAHGHIPMAMRQAAFALNGIGEISDPVRSEAGWHLVMLTGRKNAYERSYEQVKRQIQNRLFREKRQEAIEHLVQSLHARTEVRKNTEVLAELDDALQNMTHGTAGDAIEEPTLERTIRRRHSPLERLQIPGQRLPGRARSRRATEPAQ